MGKITLLLVLGVILSSLLSAEMIINKQPSEIYNLGDTVNIPVTIKSLSDISGNFQMYLLCGGKEIEFYKNGVKLLYGEERKMDPSLILTKEIIGESTGNCKIKATFSGEEPHTTNEFKISDLINLQLKTRNIEFTPGKSILIEGEAIKENKKEANGFVNVEVVSGNSSAIISELETINKGYFMINLSIPSDMKYGTYVVKMNAYERDFLGQTTNRGYAEQAVFIVQIPTSLEIIMEESEINPGTNLRVKTLLHDQTGENIESVSVIKIKDPRNLTFERFEIQTGELMEFPISYNEIPAEWSLIAESNSITSEATFKIKEKKRVKTEIINKTLIITNIGNVFYNDTIIIKIGNESLELNVTLGLDENQKYTLSAPEGEYMIEIMADGENQLTENVMLTGKAISVKESKEGVVSLVRYPIVWIFIIAILGFISFMIAKKGYKRSFFGYIRSRKKEEKKAVPLKKKSLVTTKNKAELSLSIKGEKQNISLVCLRIKNLKEVESDKGKAEGTLQKVVDVAEEYKSVVYENHDSIFFILSPLRTRTFKNEKSSVELSQKIKEIILEHNRIAKQKIEFGISLNYGAIVAKQDPDSFKFMSLGTLITTAKKIALISEMETLLSQSIKEKLPSNIKTEKKIKDNVHVYSVKEIKDTEENKKFIRNFLKKIEKKE